ncbi:MAG: hypothetical protein HYR73_01845 [Candidatus Eisenbacteria bacterium]|nr:hypothetical protein [Candidatus Eisenbacteria bacterium]
MDNLPPATPAPFTGTYASGVTQMQWGANGESDLTGYRLYRGNSAGFTPSPENLIASTPLTSYTDVAGTTHSYKLSATDVHGNESAFATLIPVGSLDAPGDPLPRELSLLPVAPDPARAPLTLRYLLPHEANVRLAIFDAAWRRVRDFESYTEKAGEHLRIWDGLDAAGNATAGGLYFARFEAEGRVLTRRFVRLR